jgi:hypothetical protein
MNVPIQFINNDTIVHLVMYTLPARPKYSELSEYIKSIFPSNRGFKITIYYFDGSNESFEYIDEVPDDIEETYILKQVIGVQVFTGTKIRFNINWNGILPDELLLKSDKPIIRQLMEFIDTTYRSTNKQVTSKQILHLKLTRGRKNIFFTKDTLGADADQEYQEGDTFEFSYVDPKGLVFIPQSKLYTSNLHEFSFLGDTPASDHVQLEATQYADELAGEEIKARLRTDISHIENEEHREKFTRVVNSLSVEECRRLARRLIVSSETSAVFLQGIYDELNEEPEEEILRYIRGLIANIGGKRTKRKRTKRKRTKRKLTKRKRTKRIK